MARVKKLSSVKKVKIDLELALPDDADACDACVDRILASLRGRTGLADVHVERANPTKPKLCLHYDPDSIPLERVQALVEQAGAEVQRRYAHLSIAVNGLRHERQANLAEGVVAKLPGVLRASIAFGARRLFAEYDPTKTTRSAIVSAFGRAGLATSAKDAASGVGRRGDDAADGEALASAQDHAGQDHPAKGAAKGKDDGHDHGEKGDDDAHEHGGPFGESTELVFSLTCGVLTGVGWGIGKAGVAPMIPTALFIGAYLLGGWFTVQEVFVALRARQFEIDFLMLVAAIGAAALGNWFEGALLLFLFTLGHALEGYAMGRARRAIEALSKLVPATALRIDASGVETEVGVDALAVGNRILVKPNTRVPADGFVLSGTSSVDQAPITGESVPVDKVPAPDAAAAAANPASLAPEHRVFAGTINGPSALTVVVTKAAADSTLARVVTMVAEAETQKSATQRFTDRFERVFVPVIIGVVVLLLFAGFVIDEPFAKSFYRAMSVLVAASPCALAIATPSAVLAGVARAARGGVLVKGGAHLESLGAIQTIAFDKTGTLTEGKPKLTDVVATPGADEVELLRVTLAVERQSDHPLASAIVTGAASRLPPATPAATATGVVAIMGFGIRAVVDGVAVSIGKPGMFTKNGALPSEVASAAENLQASGRTIMMVKAGERFLGVIGVMDAPRESAREVIAELHRLGIAQTLMLSGDNQRVAEAVAKQVGIRTVRGDLLPEDKVKLVTELARSFGGVAMVGDGVNDAPAMANATVGIAMGAGGSDVALETADVALMADDLRALPFAMGLSRSARAIIRQNLWASLGMVLFLIPATIFGIAGIGIAVALHEGSTLLVVANALRLLAYKDPRKG